jgi:hypothetical protein
MKRNRIIETSPRVYARATGLLYLIVIAAGMFAQMVISDRIVVNGNAAATAANILAHRSMFQLGFTVYLIEMAAQIAMIVLLYLLLRPVNRSIALMALFFGLTGCIIKTLSRLFYIAPLLILGDAPYLTVFGAGQLQALGLLLLDLNEQSAGMALGFFGISTLLNGILILRSNFLPRFLGLLSILGGLGWLTFLYPPLGSQLFPYILVVGVLGSVSQILWLLVKGVNVERWEEWALATA